ncbi:hypothetical protein ACWDUC_02770 [Streptomyces tricolor]|uniref:hypothetical protein n=1 Tax=Streptomyces tricolor TaxID=68277 RepID=UPI0013027E4C|nr:hypothetical protein [Streptomyces tricolor]
MTKIWARHPAWPTPAGKGGRYKKYAVQDRSAIERQAAALGPEHPYTAHQLETRASASRSARSATPSTV